MYRIAAMHCRIYRCVNRLRHRCMRQSGRMELTLFALPAPRLLSMIKKVHCRSIDS